MSKLLSAPIGKELASFISDRMNDLHSFGLANRVDFNLLRFA
jgi:hypothetical protein